MIGTEQGNIMTCNKKAKNPQDRVGASFPGQPYQRLCLPSTRPDAAMSPLCFDLAVTFCHLNCASHANQTPLESPSLPLTALSAELSVFLVSLYSLLPFCCLFVLS